MTLDGFFHIASMNHWQFVVSEIVQSIVNSGLYDRSNRIYIGYLGHEDGFKWVQSYSGRWCKFRILYSDGDLSHCEWPTLQGLYEQAGAADAVWYMHTKGVSNYSEINEAWRHTMLYYMTRYYRKMLLEIEEYGRDTCGICWMGDHYCGNFWYARSAYVARLDSPAAIRENPGLAARFAATSPLTRDALERKSYRHLCESWLGYGQPVAGDLERGLDLWQRSERTPA